MATSRKNRKFYVFTQKANRKIGKEPFLEEDIFENSPLIFMAHKQGEDPEVYFNAGEDDDGVEVGIFTIDCLPMGAERITHKEFKEAVGSPPSMEESEES